MPRFRGQQRLSRQIHASLEKHALGFRAGHPLFLVESRYEIDGAVGHRGAQLGPLRVDFDPDKIRLDVVIAVDVRGHPLDGDL